MKKIHLILSIMILAFMSCSAPKALEYQTYNNFKIENLGFNNSEVSLNLDYNPNNFGLQLRKTDLDIFIDGNLLGHNSLDTLLLIPKRDTFNIPVKFNVNMKNVFKNAWNTLIGKEVLVRLSGKVKVGKANVFMNIPVEYESKQIFSFF